MAARAGFEPTTLRSKGFDSTNTQPRPTCMQVVSRSYNSVHVPEHRPTCRISGICIGTIQYTPISSVYSLGLHNYYFCRIHIFHDSRNRKFAFYMCPTQSRPSTRIYKSHKTYHWNQSSHGSFACRTENIAVV